MSGKQPLMINLYNSFDHLMNTDAVFNGKTAFKDFPCQSKNGFAFEPYLCVAMSSKSKSEDGVWRFICSILDENFQAKNSFLFPSNRMAFDTVAAAAMTVNTEPPKNYFGQSMYSAGGKDTDGDGEIDIYPKGQINSDGVAVYYFAISQDQYKHFMDFINHIDRVKKGRSPRQYCPRRVGCLLCRTKERREYSRVNSVPCPAIFRRAEMTNMVYSFSSTLSSSINFMSTL